MLNEVATTGVAGILGQIGVVLTAFLEQMSAVLSWVVGEPLIVFMIAVGFAGVVIRWAKRMIHTN